MKNTNILFLSLLFIILSVTGYKEYRISQRVKTHEEAILKDLKFFYWLASNPKTTKNYEDKSYIDEIIDAIYTKFYTDSLNLSYHFDFRRHFRQIGFHQKQIYTGGFKVENVFNTAKISGDITYFSIKKLTLINEAYANIEDLRQSFIAIKKLELECFKIEQIDNELEIKLLTHKIIDIFGKYQSNLLKTLFSIEKVIKALERNNDWIAKAQAAYKTPTIYYYGKLPDEKYFISDSLAIEYGFKMKYIDSIPEHMKGKNWKAYNNDADKTLHLKWGDTYGTWKEIFEEDTGKSLDIYFDNKP